MEFYPKDKNPMLDERTARFHGRVLKAVSYTHLTLPTKQMV